MSRELEDGVVLAIDIGTTTTKAALITADMRRLRSFSKPSPGSVTHLWPHFCSLCRELLDLPGSLPEIRAVGLTGYFPSLIALDHLGSPSGYSYAYWNPPNDAALKKRLHQEALGIPHFHAAVLADLSEGGFEFGPAKSGHRFVSSIGYVIGRLTGNSVVDPSQAADAYVYCPETQSWNTELLSEWGIPLETLPEIRSSGEIVGGVTKKASEVTGLPENTPVIAGCGDVVAHALSAQLDERERTLLITYGTTACLLTVAERPVGGTRLGTCPYPVKGKHLIVAATSSTGSMLEWIARNLRWHNMTEEIDLDGTFEAINRQAEDVPAGAGGHMILPFFRGSRAPNRNAKASGMILGLRNDSEPVQIYKAALEAVGFNIRAILEAIEEETGPIDELLACGGGTHNEILVQTVSDVTGRPQLVFGDDLDSLTGIAGLAYRGLGSEATYSGHPAKGVLTTPHGESTELYHAFYDTYTGLSTELLSSMEMLDSYRRRGDCHD